MTEFSPENFKKNFPLFKQRENQQLIYLDNAATTQRPQCVLDAITHFYTHSNANTHRSSHRLARAATSMVEATRVKTAGFLNAHSDQEIIFTRGATEALNLLAFSLTEALLPGDEIILSQSEHHANLVPWQMAAQRHELVLKFLDDDNGIPVELSLDKLLSSKTKIIAITAASNATGNTVDIKRICAKAKHEGFISVIDGSQLAAHKKVNVQNIDCDFFVCAPHKFYGPTGIGILYGREAYLKKLSPWQGGGEMIRSVTLQASEYAEPPHRFETGTSSLAAIAGLNACLDFLGHCQRDEMLKYEAQLVEYAHQKLSKIKGIRLLNTVKNNLGIINFIPTGDVNISVADLAMGLDEQDIAVRAGRHCAMPLMDNLGYSASIRASLAAYNSKVDIDKLVEGIRNVLSLSVDVELSPVLHKAEDESFGDDLSSLSLDALTGKKGWQQRYKQIMQWSACISEKPNLRKPEYLVNGCESEAWLIHQERGGKHYFALDSESRIVKGLAVILLILIDGKSTDEIQSLDLTSTFQALGLDKHLSESRSNGLLALVSRALSCLGN